MLQSNYGSQVKKPTTLAGNLELDPAGSQTKVKEVREVKSSKDLARWPPGVNNGLMRHLLRRSPQLRAVSWSDHIAMGHVPYRRDCFVCQQNQQQQKPHRSVEHPHGGVLSLDTAGPLIWGKDLGGRGGRYIMVGALTWAVSKDARTMKDSMAHDADQSGDPLPPAAPEIEEKKEVDEEKEEGSDAPMAGGSPEAMHLPGRDAPAQDEAAQVEHLPAEDLCPPEDIEGLPPVLAEGDDYQVKIGDEVKEFVVKTFRMAIPMRTKTSKEVTSTVMEMVLRLRADGFSVSKIHTDAGKEFSGSFKSWMSSRGIHHTRTSGDSPQTNGRAELAVKMVKTQARRLLCQAGLDATWWPWAVRHLNEIYRAHRRGEIPSWPPFFEPVIVRKRGWKRGDFLPTSEIVMYLCPSKEDHGHWVLPPGDGEAPRLTRYVLLRGKEPPTEEKWLAIERETLDELAVRRRIRGKRSIRRFGMTEEEVEEAQRQEEFKRRVEKMIKEEVPLMIHDDPSLVSEEMVILANLRKMVTSNESPLEEVLQTKIVSQKEVVENWPRWKEAVEGEVKALLEEKEALRPIGKDELQRIIQEAEAQGKRVEIVPSKMVFTTKPGPKGGKPKARWVVCGNFEAPKESEQNYSGGADAAACRILVGAASYHQWEGGTLDVKTAFLNADMWQGEEEDILIVKPPTLLKDQKVIDSSTWFVPLRAVYGFRRSPRLWGKTRDQGLDELEIVIVEGEKKTHLSLSQLVSEPNLWKIEEKIPEDSGFQGPRELYGLLMTYVDDMLIVGSDQVVSKTMEAIQLKWKTSTPDRVTSVPVKFLGVEISKQYDPSKGRDVWLLSQESYTQDLLQREASHLKPRKIPITRDQTSTPEVEEEVSAQLIKQSQKEVGELLWLVTRSRPDLMFAVARMSTMVLKWPQRVHEIYEQTLGYLLSTPNHGLQFALTPEEPVTIEAYSDASFAPEGSVSHGCFMISLQGSVLFWRSGRQHLTTLSTAESELVEIIEAMVAGESIHVMAYEIFGSLPKRMWTDSQAAIGILCSEGGSWRTRHLRVRSSAAREAFMDGEWFLAHLKGESMVADLGTKPLASSRLEFLKKEMGMCPRPQEEKKGEEEEKEEKKGEEKKEEKMIQWTLDQARAAEAIRLISIAAALTIAKGENETNEEENEVIDLTIPALILTFLIIFATLGMERIWEAAVRWFQRNNIGSHPGLAPEESQHRGDAPEATRQPAATLPRGRDAPQPEAEHLPGRDAPQEDEVAHLPSGDAPGTQSESTATHPQAPLPEGYVEATAEEIMQAWDEIEREEAAIWAEMNRRPEVYGAEDPPATPQREPTEDTMGPLEFQVFKTRYGSVYHVTRTCGHLRAPQVREVRELHWCTTCRRVASTGRGRPPPGVNLWIKGWGLPFHTDPRCPHAFNTDEVRVCSSCSP